MFCWANRHNSCLNVSSTKWQYVHFYLSFMIFYSSFIACHLPWEVPSALLQIDSTTMSDSNRKSQKLKNFFLYFDFWWLSLLNCRPKMFLLIWNILECLGKHLTRHATHRYFTLSFARLAFLSASVVFTPTGRHEFTGCRQVIISRWG